MKKTVLGIQIDDINMEQALKIVEKWLSKPGKHYVVTPNPEIIVMARADKELKNIINNADLSIPDGMGLKITGDIVCHIPGIDFMEELIKRSQDYGFTIGLLGGKDGVAKKASECLMSRYPKIKISFANGDIEVDEDGQEIESRNMNHESKEKNHNSKFMIPNTDLLFVGFGPPKQEKWIAKNLKKIPVRVAMGVGGAFDYISGTVPRAPKFIRNMGFEWLFRLIVQPWRIKRQFSLIKYIVLLMIN